MTLRSLGLTAAVLGAAAVAGFWLVRRPAATPEMRGARLAVSLGCFACHGQGGTGGLPNPGSEEGEVPGWTGGTLMMYAEQDAELAEWIRDGSPRRLRERPEGYRPAGLLRMPAFRDRASAHDVADLAAYVSAVGAWRPPRERAAAAGLRAANRLGCFGCHGPRGRTGSANPGSLKGIVPPWSGGDFADLVRDDGELRGWIQDGHIPRLDRNPAAQVFIRRQLLAMPAYRKELRPGELEALIGYIRWVRTE